jgi:CheY-like chemotaxis protein
MSHRCHASVLIVDDDAELRNELRVELERAGFSVALARDGSEALDYLGANPAPRVIVTDLFMPGMNGGDFMALLERDAGLSKIAVLVMTGAATCVLAEALTRSGAVVLAKPFPVEALIDHLDHHCSEPALTALP